MIQLLAIFPDLLILRLHLVDLHVLYSEWGQNDHTSEITIVDHQYVMTTDAFFPMDTPAALPTKT